MGIDMNCRKLTDNITELLKEEQVKLGYRPETVRLYYPLTSLNRLLDCELDAEKMLSELRQFVSCPENPFGPIEISRRGKRFSLAVPPEGAAYVHSLLRPGEFIWDLVRAVERHGCTLDEVLAQFHKHSEHVHIERMKDAEFDYLVYFEDGRPDNFRYCITDEGHHVTYHRFSLQDYEDLMG